MENRVKEKQSEIKLLSNDEAACMRAVKDIANMIKKKEAEFSTLNKNAQKAFSDLQQAKLDAEDSSGTGVDVSTLQEELDSLNVDLSKHQSSLKEAEFAFTQAKEAHDIAETPIINHHVKFNFPTSCPRRGCYAHPIHQICHYASLVSHLDRIYTWCC